MTATQKDRWADRAERRAAWADAAEAKAAALEANHCTDWAFISQPGHLPARARQIAQKERAMELRARAAAHREKAANLNALASRQKGDAESQRQTVRDAMDAVKAGDTVLTTLYGPRQVVRVNKKTFSVRDSFGGTMTVDKAHCKVAA